MTTIYLIRHGETDVNRNTILAGWYNAQPTELGLRQGEAVALRLKDVHADAIYASDLDRAMTIANQIARYHDMPVIPVKGLREISIGEWEGLTVPQAREGWPEVFKVWDEDPGHVVYPGGEGVQQMTDRFSQTVIQLAQKHPDQTIFCATHGYALRTLYLYCHGMDVGRLGETVYVPNASISRLSWDGEKLTMLSYGESDYLSGMVTELKGFR